MSTVNFSVPDDVKDAFNAAFAGCNKSAVITALMREAVERAQRRQQHADAVDRIVAGHERTPVVTEAAFRSARARGRP